MTANVEHAWIPNADDSFGARLALVRWKMSWNMKEAALACGLPQQSWRQWEVIGSRPRNYAEVAAAISQATGVDDYWLMTGHSMTRPNGPDGGKSQPKD